MMSKKTGMILKLLTPAMLLMTSGCVGASMGGGGNAISGAAGGATSVGANTSLQRCDKALGTLAIAENTGSSWYQSYRSASGQGSIEPVLKMIIQQSNCFMVVSRSGNFMAGRSIERGAVESGEARAGSNMGKGQLKVADYLMETSVFYADENVGGAVAGIGGLLGGIGGTVAGLAGGLNQKHTSVALNLTDSRSTQQISAAEGSSSSTDIGGAIGALGGLVGGGAGGYTNTPEGKALAAAFLDAYNKMVISVKNYKKQESVTPYGTPGLAVD
jgi:curli biogenesis system outer membrane secretion channel CsgG